MTNLFDIKGKRLLLQEESKGWAMGLQKGIWKPAHRW